MDPVAFLPMFPLQLVVFPNEELNLHIFEPRYQQLVRECELEGFTFGIPVFLDGKVSAVGTEIRLHEIENRFPSGEMDIRTKALDRFRIRKFLNPAPGKMYAGAEVERFSSDVPGDPEKSRQLLGLLSEFFLLLKLEKPLPENPLDFSTFDFGHFSGLSQEQEYELLCIAREPDRQQFLINHLKEVLPLLREIERTRDLIQQNGHFKNLKPPRV